MLTGTRRTLLSSASSKYPNVPGIPRPALLYRLNDSSPQSNVNFSEYYGGHSLQYNYGGAGDMPLQPPLTPNGSFSYLFNEGYANTTSSAPGSSNAAFTLSVFLRTYGAVTTYNTLFTQNWVSGTSGFLFSTAFSGSANYQLHVAGSSGTVSVAWPLVGTTVYLTLIYDGAGNWYVNQNGVRLATALTGVTFTPTASHGVNLLYGPGANPWPSYVCDFRLWNVALTTAQDLAVYEAAGF